MFISRMSFIRWRSNSNPPFTGRTAPVVLVPVPLGVTGIFSLWASFIMADICSVVRGKITASGTPKWTDMSLE